MPQKTRNPSIHAKRILVQLNNFYLCGSSLYLLMCQIPVSQSLYLVAVLKPLRLRGDPLTSLSPPGHRRSLQQCLKSYLLY